MRMRIQRLGTIAATMLVALVVLVGITVDPSWALNRRQGGDPVTSATPADSAAAHEKATVTQDRGTLFAQVSPQTAGLPDRELVIGTKEAPPFAMKAPDGTWTGISIDLWRQIAEKLGV